MIVSKRTIIQTKREVKSSNTQGAVGEINGIGAIGVARGVEKGGGAAASELLAMYGSTTSRPTLTSSF